MEDVNTNKERCLPLPPSTNECIGCGRAASFLTASASVDSIQREWPRYIVCYFSLWCSNIFVQVLGYLVGLLVLLIPENSFLNVTKIRDRLVVSS